MADENFSIEDSKIKEVISDALNASEIISVKSEQAVPAGEHYLSTLLRVYVTYRGKNSDKIESTRLIIKALPGGVLTDFMQESEMFIKEMITYNKIIPSITEERGKHLTPVRLGPNRVDILVLEDLKPLGFQMKNRVEKLDFLHAKEALIQLADFHAASIVVHEKSPELFDEIKVEKIYIDSNNFMRSFITNNFRTIADEFEKVPNLKKYSERLRKVANKAWSDVRDAVIPTKDEINVFCHGDFWTTNILYRYDDKNNIKEVRFVDFQFCRWGSPAFDLQMLYITSLRDRKRIPELTSIYLERLNQHLHPNTISADRFEKEMRRLDCYGFMQTIATMALCILDPNTPMDFKDTTKDDYNNDFPEDKPNPYLVALKDKKFLSIIPEFLEFYDKLGLF